VGLRIRIRIHVSWWIQVHLLKLHLKLEKGQFKTIHIRDLRWNSWTSV
jgi:hypothetical protein